MRTTRADLERTIVELRDTIADLEEELAAAAEHAGDLVEQRDAWRDRAPDDVEAEAIARCVRAIDDMRAAGLEPNAIVRRDPFGDHQAVRRVLVYLALRYGIETSS